MSSRVKVCADCQKPSTISYVPEHPLEHCSDGDIFAIFEKTSTPIYLLLTGNPPPSRGTMVSDLSWGTVGWAKHLRAQAAKSEMEEKEVGRPAVILRRYRARRGQPVELQVCMMATFSRAGTVASLPRVLQHFCIPIYPHAEIRPDGVHAHITPSWPLANTWLIALPITCKMDQIERRWEDNRPGCPPGSSFRLIQDELGKIESLCRTRLTSWEVLCAQDATLKENSLKEYKYHLTRAVERRKAETESGPQPGSAPPAVDQSRRRSYAQIVQGLKQPTKESSPSIKSTQSKARSILNNTIIKAGKRLFSSSKKDLTRCHLLKGNMVHSDCLNTRLVELDAYLEQQNLQVNNPDSDSSG
ncbi:hypothetical protein PYCCODRAFT_1428890 [Trametes coccinea BRFM310]|uniref:Uncharacterized protein n=1 Tax=Trametes coccinea (strain BRFM310) TaxID=1353009 RepID=A0A1Y2I7Z2_TRAC3|nr:hypothetical protein PYCCODRAFT_1428890 [Trametes coccinea BRFM310]